MRYPRNLFKSIPVGTKKARPYEPEYWAKKMVQISDKGLKREVNYTRIAPSDLAAFAKDCPKDAKVWIAAEFYAPLTKDEQAKCDAWAEKEKQRQEEARQRAAEEAKKEREAYSKALAEQKQSIPIAIALLKRHGYTVAKCV